MFELNAKIRQIEKIIVLNATKLKSATSKE